MPRVTLVASTELESHITNSAGQSVIQDTIEQWLPPNSAASRPDYDDADLLAEFAGRSCYLSWNRPNPKTAQNTDYIANILNMEHYSVLEHASATFYITDVSRSFTHELIRHRHLSYSQLSQRYVNPDGQLAYPPALDDTERGLLDELSDMAARTYDTINQRLTDRGYKRKQAREAARSALPNAQSTSVLVTGNHRAWREFLTKRMTSHADAEMQEVATLIYHELYNLAPHTYQDFKDTSWTT